MTSLPTYPGPGASASELTAYQAELELYRAETARLHAQAQADTAAAMQASVAAVSTPPPAAKPTRAQLVWEMVTKQPQASILTPGQIVTGATQIVDAYIKAFPAAVEG